MGDGLLSNDTPLTQATCGGQCLSDAEVIQELKLRAAEQPCPVFEPAIAAIQRLTRELAEVTADRDTLRDLLIDKGGMPAASAADETAAEPIAWTNSFQWAPRQSEIVLKLTRHAQPRYGFTVPLYAGTPVTQAAGVRNPSESEPAPS